MESVNRGSDIHPAHTLSKCMKLLRALLITGNTICETGIQLWPFLGGRNWFDIVAPMFFSILILKNLFLDAEQVIPSILICTLSNL